MLQCVISSASEPLTHHRAHRAAEKLKLERARDDGHGLELAGHNDQCIFLAGAFLCCGETIFVLFAITKLERIFRRDFTRQLDGRAFIEESQQTIPRTDAHVMRALRTHMQITLELSAIERRVTSRAFDPQAFGHRARTPLSLDT